MRFVHPAGPDQLHKVEVVHLSALRRDSPVSHKQKTKDGAELLILLAFHVLIVLAYSRTYLVAGWLVFAALICLNLLLVHAAITLGPADRFWPI